MRDGIDGRLWADHHQAFSAGIAGLLAAAGNVFKRLNHIQRDAPWRRCG